MAAPSRRSPEDDAGPSEHGLEVFVGYRLRRAWLAIQADLVVALRPFDLRMVTYTALVLVKDNPGLSQAQLAALMDMERPNLVAIIEELSTRGLVRRDRASGDRRAYALHVTAAGEALCQQATQAVAAHEARLTAGVSDADRRVLEAALARIRHNAERG